jgi:signal transduction histidine kinase
MATTIERETLRTTSQPEAHARSTRPAALALAGLAVAAAAWAVAHAVGNGSSAMLQAALAAVWALTGVQLARKDEPHAPIVSGAAVIGGVGAAWPAAAPFAAALLPAAGMHLFLSMPDGVLRSTVRRVLAGIGYLSGLAVGGALWSSRPDFPLWPVALLIAVAALISIPPMLTSFRRSTGHGRKRMEWLGWGTVVAGGLAVLLGALRVLVQWPPHVGDVAASCTAFVPIGLAAASSIRARHSIDRVLAATISLAGLTGVVVGVYLLIVLGLGRVPHHQERTLLILSMAAAGLAALLYIPAHSRLRAFATRLVYGERQAPDDVIRNFGSRLSRAIPLDELLLQMVESLRKTLGLSTAEVWRASGGVLERAVSDPERGPAKMTLTAQEEQTVARTGVSGTAWAKIWLPRLLSGGREDANLRVAPVAHSGDLLGLIVVERRDETDLFDADDDRVLADLARQVGLTLHNVRLDSALQESLDEVRRQAVALQESRARIVAAGDRERRRIERNLHDGAQQHLVALAVKVRLIRQLAERDADRAGRMLEELAGDVEETLQELRDLAHGIYPPLLADKGLPDALASAARRAVLPTSVQATTTERFPADVEAAVYFCCLEALQNAGKHAGEGAAITIRVWEEEGGLLFEVADTGAGFDVAHRGSGAGFVNMTDRLGAMGGHVRVESAPGRGTKIQGRIPLAVEANT